MVSQFFYIILFVQKKFIILLISIFFVLTIVVLTLLNVLYHQVKLLIYHFTSEKSTNQCLNFDEADQSFLVYLNEIAFITTTIWLLFTIILRY